MTSNTTSSTLIDKTYQDMPVSDLRSLIFDDIIEKYESQVAILTASLHIANDVLKDQNKEIEQLKKKLQLNT